MGRRIHSNDQGTYLFMAYWVTLCKKLCAGALLAISPVTYCATKKSRLPDLQHVRP